MGRQSRREQYSKKGVEQKLGKHRETAKNVAGEPELGI